MQKFDEVALKQRLQSMQDWQIIAFTSLCCERMLPNFNIFSKETLFGDPLILRKAIDVAWRYIEDQQFPPDLNGLKYLVRLQAPDTELFSSQLTSSALDAANAAAILLDSLEFPKVENAVEVACLSRDTVDIHIQLERCLDPNSPTLEDDILSDSLMQQELLFQNDDLNQIEKLPNEPSLAVNILRQIAKKYTAGSLVMVSEP